MADEAGRLLAALPAVAYAADGDRLTYISPHAAVLLGHAPERLLAEPGLWADCVHPDDRGPDGRPACAEFRVRRPDGSTTWVRDVRSGDGAGLLVEIPAPGDERSLLAEHVRLAVARANEHDRVVAVLHAGIDGLELLSDGLGPAAAHTALEEIAARARAVLRAGDVLATTGPAEMTAVLTDLDGEAQQVAEAVAGELLESIRRPLVVEARELDLGGHVGVSLCPGDAADDGALVRHAQAAMRQARADGAVPLMFYAGGTSEALERLLVGARLRRALERDELRLHYQPIFRLDDGGVSSVEALLRWEDPDRGLIPPLDFIPVAEYTGIIEPIGRWVVAELGRQARAWDDAGLEVPISFNVSPRQFRDPAFPGAVRDTLEREALDGSRLIVEITESVAMRDPACVEPILEELRGLGVRVAIDDFGTGHSSLARLQELHVDVLKIDRAFLAGAPGDDHAERLVRGTLDLARTLGLTAVAEGVETEDQRQFLSDRGCELAQGFHLARPLPPAEATALLQDRWRATA